MDGQEVAEEFNDDRSGKKLDPKKVRQAREEELVELDRQVYVEADVEECVRVMGKKPIQVCGWTSTEASASTRRKGFQAEEQDRRPRGTLRRDPAAGGREVPHHAGRDQVQTRSGAEGHADRHQQGPSVCAHRGSST